MAIERGRSFLSRQINRGCIRKTWGIRWWNLGEWQSVLVAGLVYHRIKCNRSCDDLPHGAVDVLLATSMNSVPCISLSNVYQTNSRTSKLSRIAIARHNTNSKSMLIVESLEQSNKVRRRG